MNGYTIAAIIVVVAMSGCLDDTTTHPSINDSNNTTRMVDGPRNTTNTTDNETQSNTTDTRPPPRENNWYEMNMSVVDSDRVPESECQHHPDDNNGIPAEEEEDCAWFKVHVENNASRSNITVGIKDHWWADKEGGCTQNTDRYHPYRIDGPQVLGPKSSTNVTLYIPYCEGYGHDELIFDAEPLDKHVFIPTYHRVG